MRVFFANLLVLTLIFITLPRNLQAQSYGLESNRAVGLVYKRETNKPFGRAEATVEIYKRERNNDRTNEDGIYYIKVPKDIDRYQLVYRAKEYWSQISEVPIENNNDPEKIKKILLRKRNPTVDSANMPDLAKLLETEYLIYSGSMSNNTKQAIRADLIDYFKRAREEKVGDEALKLAERTLSKMDVPTYLYK